MPWTMKPMGFLALLFLVAGCQPLNKEETIKLAPGTMESKTVSAPRSDQKVKITVISAGVPVSAYLALEQNREKIEKKLNANKKPDASEVIASQEKTESATLEGTVPAKNEFTVIVQNMGTKTVEVKIHITGH